MNTNPWFLERMAEYEMDRIQRDMKQIRLEEEAMQAGRVVENLAKARLSPPRRLMLIVPTIIQWISCVGR